MPRHVFYESLRSSVARCLRRGRVERLLDRSTHFVLPSWCAGCEEALPWRPSTLGLCAACRTRLPPPPAAHRCPLCGAAAPPRPQAWLCPRCARRPPAFDRLIAAWSYRPPIDEVIRRLKYRRLEFLADDLAAAMAEVAADLAPSHDWITGVPLHWRRRLERGYDQAALLARSVSGRLGRPYRPALARARATPPQTAKSAAGRRANVAGAFRCRPSHLGAVRGAHVLLIDDVATTGATLDAASRALKTAGAAWVTALVAALTPPD